MRRMTPWVEWNVGPPPVAADACQAEITKLSRVEPAAAGLYTFIDGRSDMDEGQMLKESHT
jgi:hypothetical protein